MAHCKACDLELEPDAERCPKCLRKSTVARADDDDAEESAPPAWIGVRAAVAAVGIALGAVIAWSIFAHEAWLESHHLWLAAILASLGLVTMPLRVAFRLPSDARSAREAFRLYAIATLGADGIILVFAAVTACASFAIGDSVIALPVGLLAFFMLLVAAPVVVVAIRRPRELPATLRQAGKHALALTGLVVIGSALVALRAPEKKTIVIPEDPKALLDPMDLEHVPVAKRTTREADGATTRHVRADGGELRRTLLALDVAVLTAVDESKKDASASGLVRCWVPPRLRSPENAAELAKEQSVMEGALTNVGAKTPSGRTIHVSFDFGDLPE